VPADPARPELALPVAGRLPRLTLSVSEACDVLGVGHDFWQEHIAPEIRIVRAGRRKLVPVTELVRWIDRHAEAAFEPRAHGSSTRVPTQISSVGAGSRGVRASRAPAPKSGPRAA